MIHSTSCKTTVPDSTQMLNILGRKLKRVILMPKIIVDCMVPPAFGLAPRHLRGISDIAIIMVQYY